ncbi:AsmA family protein [Mucilaginibacter arboris]|uniref:AsmA family protein n=1 Tax=Mucilaginibacter arboris TaxID=2682090 RepID=A0A7K1STG9_9SPHI|nr:AsmA-like C-terminal region-containing protein [Mucilaginibacter arboris]MVN20591.1 AsmA family protein [Mucilaginibacter arboris]
MPRWLKTLFKIFAILVGLLLIALVAATSYINFHKQYFLNAIIKELNKNLHGGTLTIASMNPSFLSGFPGISVTLKDVVLRDSLWKVHHHTLLEAKNFNISVNAFALMHGAIKINKMGLDQATIYLYTDSTGYSNTFVLRKQEKPKSSAAKNDNSTAEVRQFYLNQVNFILDNQKGHKLFHFAVDNLKGKIDYKNDDWNANLNLKVLAKSMAFNTLRGSFIKDKLLQGTIVAAFNATNGIITVAPNTLNIGDDPFIISGKFSTIKNPGDFTIDITEHEILWKRASALLAPNITSHLNMFDLKHPFDVNAVIAGSFNKGGDPAIDVKCTVKNNTLSTPEGTVDSCSFQAAFTNNYIKGKGLTDENSAIKIYQLTGNYEQVPFRVDTGIISNLNKPIAAGKLKSKFAVARLNHLFSETLNLTKGTADLDLSYTANIVDFKLVKPIVHGLVNIKNADVNYLPRKLNFKNTSISLNFTGDDLYLKNIHLQSGRSIVYMEGSVKNFLNLYYTAPEKILVNWQIRSPQLYLGEFLGFLSGKRSTTVKKRNSTNFADQLNTVLEKGSADMHLHVDKAYYFKFMATDVNADLLLSETGIEMKNVQVKNSGGSVNLNGRITQNGVLNHFAINTSVNNVNISNFFYSFDNFGLKDFTYKNLRGFLFLKSNISGNLTDQGKIVPRSINGTVNLNLKKGALLDFEPITNVGKFAFPLRNLNNITFNNLDGKFDLHGDKITINPMMINSSVLNMNVAGIYSLSKGTNIALDIPLRNPKKDEGITNQQEKQERRMKGIVLHILASDGENGKIKFGWNKNHH